MNQNQQEWDNDSFKILKKLNKKTELRTIKQKLTHLIEYFQDQICEIKEMIAEVSQSLEYKLDNLIYEEAQYYYYEGLNEAIEDLIQNIQLEPLQICLKNYFENIISFDDSLKQKLLDEQQQQKQQKLMQQINAPNKKEQKKPFTYELYSKKEFEDNKQKKYNAFCFNKDNTILMAACGDEIKIIKLTNQIKVIGKLKQHSDTITCLQFMDKQNLLISGGRDQLINIWECQQSQRWVLKTTLKGHQDGITCLTTNFKEDFIVSGSFDSNIKFWTSHSKWSDDLTFWTSDSKWSNDFTLTCHQDKVLGLSLNDLGDTLISCGSENRIYVSRSINNTNFWNTEQIIQVKETAIRLSFIENLQFSVQQDQSEHIEIYSFNQENNQFQQTDQIKVPKNTSFDFGFFPSKYTKQKELLLVKNGLYVNLIKNVKNPQMSEVVSLGFSSKLIFGALSNDGEFLVTWDADSGSIQLRKFKQN